MPQQVLCPTCGRKIQWSEDFPYRPFCCERCRLIDLGAWVNEQRAIPDEDAGSSPPDSSEIDV